MSSAAALASPFSIGAVAISNEPVAQVARTLADARPMTAFGVREMQEKHLREIIKATAIPYDIL
jgi:hypothetical protein